MKITEISKGPRWTRDDVSDFKRKLKDPAAFELQDIADRTSEWAGKDKYSFEVYSKGDTNFIRFSFDAFDEYFSQFKSSVIERKTFKVIQKVKELTGETNNWVWDTWKGDAAGIRCYVVRK